MIGIFGGTFDPIHYGHLRAAIELQEKLGLAEIRFVPCKQPVHKASAHATAEQRLSMLKLAISDQLGFIADDREIKRNTPSYMVDTLIELKQIYPTESLHLIVGADAIIKFTSWYQWEKILELATLVVMTRPQFHFSSLPEKLNQKICVQEITQLSISATAIREMIKKENSPRFLLPDAVYKFIINNGIYR